uniref:Large ribosomal subunit protein uL1 n=2 Tax=candidate division WOR-3 bacterium TaxID=2052148 RepID=A0A7V4E237_UNCW3
MGRHSKRYTSLLEKIEREKFYKVDEAIKLVKELATAKFDETIEVSIKLGVDPRKADQMVRGACVLPYGTGKKVKVLVFTRGDEEKEAKEAGADYIGFTDLIEKIKSGWIDFDYVVASPDTMPEVSKLGKILGPRGLMPSPKTGTVTKEIGRVVSELKKGRIEFRVDKTGNIHAPIGKASFSEENLIENFLTLIEEVQNSRPSSFKGTYIQKIVISSTMGPGIKIDLNNVFEKLKERRK